MRKIILLALILNFALSYTQNSFTISGYVQDSNPFGQGYIQDSNPFGPGYVQDKSVFGFGNWLSN